MVVFNGELKDTFATGIDEGSDIEPVSTNNQLKKLLQSFDAIVVLCCAST